MAKEVISFVERLANEPKSTRGAIALINWMKHVGPCVDNRWVEDESFEDSIKASIPKKYRKRIILVPSESVSIGGIAEFYLVPKRAGLPRTIERIAHPPCCCSEISIDGYSEVVHGRQRVRYKLVLPIRSLRVPPKPMWTISSGAITRGQGSDTIEVDISDSIEEKITVEVSIADPSVVCGCPTMAKITTRILRK
ncbi:MAG: hypothetical protein PSX80_13760 [bacterium]|nr:hypothetical protein [bacterium]